jgi:spermidine/putrescine transport system permease protein
MVKGFSMHQGWKRSIRRNLELTLNVFPPFIYLLLLFYVPMSILLVISFWKSGFMTLTPGFTLHNYITFFTSIHYIKILWNTVVITTSTMIVLTLVGYPIGYYLARMVTRYDALIIFLMIVPVEIDYLVRIYAWKVVLSKHGIISLLLLKLGFFHTPERVLLYTKWAVVLVLVHEWLPYVVIPIYVSLKSIPTEVIEAARDLGAGRLTVFKEIILPLCIPGLFASFVLIYIPMLGEFAIPSIVGGSSAYMIGNVIESQFLSAGNWGVGSAIGFILLAITAILIAAVVKISGLEELM